MFQDREPDPFFWISLEGKPKPERTRPPGHEVFRNLSGRLELEIKVSSKYLYVGSGQFELFRLNNQEQAYYAFTRRGEQLVIPGTSIKGAIRSIVEAISNSCVPQTAQGEGGKVPPTHKGCHDESALCPACRLFGTTGYRGRVHFSDATPVGEIKAQKIKIADLWPPRRTQGRKFYQNKTFQQLDMRPERSHRFIEVVPGGSCFRSTLFFENIAKAEMGLLVRAMGMNQHSQDPQKLVYAFQVKLGGAKPRCLGAVRFTPKRLYLIEGGSKILSALLTGGTPKRFTGIFLRCLQDQSLLDKDAWEAFRQKAQPVSDEPCPKEVY